MPSAKPDRAEIDRLRDKRHWEYPEPRYFASIYAQCKAATQDGYVTAERAAELFRFLHSESEIAEIYPNNVLLELLSKALKPQAWCSNIEHDLIHILFSLYIGYEPDFPFDTEPKPPLDLSPLENHRELKSASWRQSLLSGYVNREAAKPDLRDKFVGFTGKFSFGTRQACFEAARTLGGVPCEPAPYMDYLFISAEFEEMCAISNKLSSAIFYRRLYGNPLILPEVVWEACANGG